MRYISFLLGLGLFLSCSNSDAHKELQNLRVELAAAKSSITDLKAQIEPEGALVHMVFFKIKPAVDINVLMVEFEKLNAIEVVKDLQAGPFEEVGDARALSDYAMMMEMSFDNIDAYKKYQEHPIHLALKEKIKPLMAGPPATYDYIKK